MKNKFFYPLADVPSRSFVAMISKKCIFEIWKIFLDIFFELNQNLSKLANQKTENELKSKLNELTAEIEKKGEFIQKVEKLKETAFIIDQENQKLKSASSIKYELISIRDIHKEISSLFYEGFGNLC